VETIRKAPIIDHDHDHDVAAACARAAALANLLLTPAEIDGVLGLTGTMSAGTADKLYGDDLLSLPGGVEWPDECVFAAGAGQAPRQQLILAGERMMPAIALGR